jgi:hypothetical protein
MRYEALIRKLFGIIDAGEWHRFSEIFSPSAVYCRPGYQEIEGIDGLLNYYKNVRIIAAGKHDLLGVMATGSSGCCWGRFDGKSRDGESLGEYFADWYDFCDELISYRRTFFYRPAV